MIDVGQTHGNPPDSAEAQDMTESLGGEQARFGNRVVTRLVNMQADGSAEA